jgi:hypothetical protein
VATTIFEKIKKGKENEGGWIVICKPNFPGQHFLNYASCCVVLPAFIESNAYTALHDASDRQIEYEAFHRQICFHHSLFL